MKYNLKNDFEYDKLTLRVKRDRELKNIIEYSKPNKKRSLSINAYLHVLIQYFASEYGDTTAYVKENIYKRKVNSEIYRIVFHNKKQNYARTDLRSSADLTDKEMSLSIERFKIYAAKEAGILLPSSDQKEFLEHCMNEIEKNKYYI